MFKAPFSFEGRIRRTEYGLTYIIYFAATFLISKLLESGNNPILGFLIFPVLWFLLAQGSKRCHDRGNSGWYQIIPLYVFWMLFAEGEYGENQYGLNPKDEGNSDNINNSDDTNDISKHFVEKV